MKRVERWTGALRNLALRTLCLIGLYGFRYGSVLVAVPLCSSACFFAFRLVLSFFGPSV
jgi:hypothetical protein